MGDPELFEWIPGKAETQPGALARFLPPLPAGIAAHWLTQNVPPHSWVLDPFGASPALTVEIARAGYRVLVVANNPILRFLITARAAAPPRAVLQAALAEIASTRKANERLETLIQNLYQTHCATCGQTLHASAFIWQKEVPQPVGRVYDCPHCGDRGEHPADPADEATLTAITGSGLHRARALERVAALNDPHRADVEEALNGYLPRPLYILFNLMNKLEGADLPPERRRWMTALILSALDEGNTLWSHPNPRPRPRQLTIPPTFRENNLWTALESAVDEWSSEDGNPVPLAIFPNAIPTEGGIMLVEGRLKDLLPALPITEIGAVLTALPRPNQAFWTLSALWTGWLWGRDAVAPLKSALSRRRYDWAWHTTALHSVFSGLGQSLPPATPIFSLVAEAEANFIGAALLAAENANMHLEGIALEDDAEQAQLLWRVQKTAPSSGLPSLALVKSAALEPLKLLGQPASTLQLVTSLMTQLVKRGALNLGATFSPSESYSQMQSMIRVGLAPAPQGAFIHYGGEHTLESGQWWHPLAASTDVLPLADRVEMEVVRALQSQPDITFETLMAILYPLFPGLLTPSTGLVSACLESYGERNKTWHLRPQDTPTLRRSDLAKMAKFADQIGNRLGYQVSGEKPILWMDKDGLPVVALWISASAVISPPLLSSSQDIPQHLLVVPPERLSLVAYKLTHDARLNVLSHNHWRTIQFDLLQRAAGNISLTRAVWQSLMESSIPNDSSVQMGFFS